MIANLTLDEAIELAVRPKLEGLGARLREVRGERTILELSRTLGTWPNNISRYERGTPAHLDYLAALAVTERVSIDWMLLGRGVKGYRDPLGRGRPRAAPLESVERYDHR